MTHKTFFNICFVLLALLFPLTMQAQPKNLLDCRVLLFPHGEIEEGKAFAEECMSEHGYPKFAEEDNIMIAGYYTFPMGQRILSDYNIKKSIWTFEPVDNGYYIRNEDNGYLSYQKYGDGPYVGSGIDNAVKFRVTIDEKDNCHINIIPFNGIDGFPNEFDLVNADDCIIQVNGIKYIIYENCKKATIIPNLIDEDNSNDYKGEIIIPEKFIYKGVEYTVTNAKPCVFAQNKNITRISLPQSIKALSNCCFSESSRITSVEVPSVSIIGENAFSDCLSLTTVNMPSVTSIGTSAFSGCSSLSSIDIPSSVTSIGTYAFSGCWRLKVIEFPSALKSIGFGAFSGCSQLEHIKLPSMLKTIGSKAFSDCSRLKNIELPPTLKTIDDNTFSGCSNLEKISLPGVETINGGAFNGCSKLSEVRIPSTLKSIGDGAFNCGNLKRVYTYTIEPVNIRQSTFSNYATATLYVPKQAYKNYYYNTQWSQFPTPMEFDEPYKYFYLNKEYTLEDRFTGEPDIDINPGGGIIVPGKPEQGADTIHIKGDGKNWASIIANANLNAKGLYIDITIKANRWYFFSFPFKVRKADISCGKNVKFVFRTYNGAIRAKYGKGGWIDLDSSEEYLYPGKGYIFQASLDCTLSIKIEKSAFGKLPKVDVDTKLDIHTSTNEQNASWNFVGNPFTAFYDINDMGYTSPITRWNSDSNTYEAVRPGDDNAFLNPFEAFFVQCPKDNDDINFGGDKRLTQTGRDKKMNSQMQKARMKGQFDVQRQIVNLTLSDGTTTDKTRVVFNPDKKAGYERDCDAAKFESNGASELYSVEALAGRLAINERPEGSVKIGYRAAKAGEYTIAAQRMDRQVLLRDNDLQITFDLTQGDYHFTSDAGEFDNRFMLLIDNSTTGIGDIVSTTGVNVKPTDSGLNISNLQGKTLHVYALNGALYATRTQDGFLGLAKGVYLVEVEGLKAKFMVR